MAPETIVGQLRPEHTDNFVQEQMNLKKNHLQVLGKVSLAHLNMKQ